METKVIFFLDFIQADQIKSEIYDENLQKIQSQNSVIQKYTNTLQNVTKNSQNATKLFIDKNYENALELYEDAIFKITPDLLAELCFLSEKQYFEKLLNIKKKCLINAALCALKLRNFNKVIQYTTMVFYIQKLSKIQILNDIDDTNSKAYHIRGKAKKEIGDINSAYSDYSIVFFY